MSLTMSTILAAAEHGAAAAAEEEHHDNTPFFVAGSVLAAFAVVISIVGFKKPDFPATAAAARGVMTASVVLVLLASASIVYVSA
ncbi:MAG: hypothetical protein Q8O56_03205 [Solirubrobacteraceae bacterium]|nr:hypothetical protein [Solirubrobacteraceae bacterium]